MLKNGVFIREEDVRKRLEEVEAELKYNRSPGLLMARDKTKKLLEDIENEKEMKKFFNK